MSYDGGVPIMDTVTLTGSSAAALDSGLHRPRLISPRGVREIMMKRNRRSVVGRAWYESYDSYDSCEIYDL